MSYGLYLHIPFCVRKCLYCDFYSLPMGRGPIGRRRDESKSYDASRFLDALEEELKSLPSGFSPSTIFLGGGTPTELADQDFERLFELIHRHVTTTEVREWTCESNPGTLTPAKADVLRASGVNRVSLGVQSFDERNLEFLGRIHTADEAEAGLELLRTKGFRQINLDLIYGIPGSPEGALERDLDRLIRLNPEHAACYCLIFEDGTPLAELQRKGFVKEVDDDTELHQYRTVRDRLGQAGFEHYEISNFSRPGYASAHNLLYWSGGSYIGIGPSAHSHWEGVRYSNIRDLNTYMDRLLSGQTAREMEERLDPEAKARETLIMSLRRRAGVRYDAFERQTGFAIPMLCGDTLDWLKREGLIESFDEGIRLTETGLFLSDGVFAELV